MTDKDDRKPPAILSFFISAVMFLAPGCGTGNKKQAGVVRIVASFPPLAAIAADVAKGAGTVEVGSLFPQGSGCIHGATLSPKDVGVIKKADIFVAGGYGLESFELKKIAGGFTLVSMGGVVTPLDLAEEHEGLPKEGKASHQVVNPHAYLSPRAAAGLALRLGEALARADSPNADRYRGNARALQRALQELGQDAQSLAGGKVVAIRSTFGYLLRDFRLECLEILVPLGHAQAPGPRRLEACAARLRRGEAGHIVLEPGDEKIAALLREKAGRGRLVLLDAMTEVHLEPGEYLRCQRHNLDELLHAFGKKK